MKNLVSRGSLLSQVDGLRQFLAQALLDRALTRLRDEYTQRVFARCSRWPGEVNPSPSSEPTVSLLGSHPAACTYFRVRYWAGEVGEFERLRELLFGAPRPASHELTAVEPGEMPAGLSAVVEWLKQRLRALLREEVAQIATDAAAVANELRHLLRDDERRP